MYQLPTGKYVYLTMEEFLDMTDQDLQALIAHNVGEYPSSYWDGSVIKRKSKSSFDVYNEIDYEPESDEIVIQTVSINDLSEDQMESMKDQDYESEEESDC